MWQRDAWLDLLGSFVHAEGGRVLFPRFHQWHAVRSILEATHRDGAGVDRLIQHSAGSGKSNTIAWTAHALSRLHGADDAPIFDKVVVITDRKVLDRQLQDTVAGLEHTPGTIVRIDEKSDQLKTALEGHAARVIITTLQKFPVVAELAAKDAAAGEARGIVGRRFAVIVDEAHSSSSGDSVAKAEEGRSGAGDAALEAAEEAEATAYEEAADSADEALLASARNRGKQKNLSFFAFTATPKPKTLDTFGQVGADGSKRPFHTYSMRQAIAEGFILDVLSGLHDLRRLLQARERPPAQRPGDGVPQGPGGAGPVRVAAPVRPRRQGRGHHRALPAEDRRQDRRARQGDGRDPVAAARGAHPGRAGRLHRAARATTRVSGRCARWWRSPAGWSIPTP